MSEIQKFPKKSWKRNTNTHITQICFVNPEIRWIFLHILIPEDEAVEESSSNSHWKKLEIETYTFEDFFVYETVCGLNFISFQIAPNVLEIPKCEKCSGFHLFSTAIF